MERFLRKAAPMTALVALCLAITACGGEDESPDVVAVGTEVALVPSVPGIPATSQMTNGGLAPQRGMLQREAAQDISPDPIPARESSGTGVVNTGTGSEAPSGGTSSETQGTTKR